MKKLSNFLAMRITIYLGIILFIFFTISSLITEKRSEAELKNNLQGIHNTKINAGNFLLQTDKPININKIITDSAIESLSLRHNCENLDKDTQDCVVLKTTVNKDFFENSVNNEYLDIALFNATGSRVFFQGLNDKNYSTPNTLAPRPSQNKNFIKSKSSKNTYIGKSETTSSGNMLIAFEILENGIHLGSMTFVVRQTAFEAISSDKNININSYAVDETGDVRNISSIKQNSKAINANASVIDACKNKNNEVFEYIDLNTKKIAIATFVNTLELCIVSESDTGRSALLGNSTFKTNYLILILILISLFFLIKFLIKKISKLLLKLIKKGEDSLLGKYDLPENQIQTNLEEISNLDKTFEFILHKLKNENKDDSKQDLMQKNILTQEKNLTSEAISNKEKFKEAVDAAQDIIILLGNTGLITYSNKALETVTGYTSKEVEGKSPYEIWQTKQNEETFKQAFGKVMTQAEPLILNLECQKSNGAKYESEVRLSPIVDKDTSKVNSVLLIERDVSDDKQKDRAKNEFISVVSHELRTPMTIIRGYSSLLVDGKLGPMNDKQKEYIERINVETSRLLDLANDMLDLQKFEAGKADLHTEKVNIKDIVQELKVEFEPLFTKKNLYLTLEDSSQNAFSMIDKRYFNRAVTNIIQNALKFTEKGGIDIYLLNPDENHLVIAIKDTGVGIAAEALPHLFGKFYQASNVLNRKQEGSGLGLSIVKKIVEAHKGIIWVESIEGTGSTFYIALPI